MTASLERAALVAVGDELLAGAHPDLNSPALSRSLAERGLPVGEVRVVPDDEAAIAAAVAAACTPGTLVVVTGGLGPTLDDVTRHAIARALGVEVETDEGARRQIESWFAARGYPMNDANHLSLAYPPCT